ncbi:hypothetical protein Desgi_2490 [Desulfoscipio gibsoniae DSM 7213]|uniref:Uncharacterized protein n=1 Tax=Desulfoscipio gibsoniae DSM 7213 TaxID=767817 RepID=R4KFE1_9FIRM|nr:hypothetical protein Desgi_2490 [Desulfoscipio gibsoniae DSM 7213]
MEKLLATFSKKLLQKTDRGSPYKSKSLKRAATILGCNIIHTAKSDTPVKGKVKGAAPFLGTLGK